MNLDEILLNCLILVLRRYKKYDNHIFGLVGAAIITKQFSPVYETAMETISGKCKHAERCAIEKFHRLYGNLPDDAIIVTTLSPCFVHMSDRCGESCSDLIKDFGIKFVYTGISDSSQLNFDKDHYKKVPYELIVSNNEDIHHTSNLLLNKISKVQDIA